MSGRKREVDQIIRQLRRSDSGCEVSKTNRGHWKVSKDGCQSVIISPQPADPRAVRNARADVKRFLSITL
jgi:Na+-translocating ferredoxin:NAD+ oxidoreductase RnfG subunit